VRGVESLQILYGIDSDAATSNQGVPNKWLRSKDFLTPADWTRIRALKVGLVIRGDVGSAPTGPQLPLYPMGEAFAGGNTTSDYMFTPPANGDGRLRKAFTTTILLRNMQ
jgi:type IV pilus assembly protein PilW